MEIPEPPEGWSLYALNRKDDFDGEHWMAYLLKEKVGYVYGHGGSPRYAMLDAIKLIEDGDYREFLSGFTTYRASVSKDLIARLGIAPKPALQEERRE